MEDKQIETEKPKVISRRRFFSWMGWGSSTAFLVSSAAAMVKFFYPKVTYEPDQQFRAGFPEDFPQGKMVFLPDWKVFVVREPEGFHAISAVCTHLGCTVIWEEKLGIFYCRCHGGRFHRDGHNFAPSPWTIMANWLWIRVRSLPEVMEGWENLETIFGSKGKGGF
jgi:Rieske Fe-S protein